MIFSDPVDGCFNLKRIVLPIGIDFPSEYSDIIEFTNGMFEEGYIFLKNCEAIGVELTNKEKLRLRKFHYVGPYAKFDNFSEMLALKDKNGNRYFDLFKLEKFYSKNDDGIEYYDEQLKDIKDSSYAWLNRVIIENMEQDLY